MKNAFISCTVPGESSALAILDICRRCWSSARLVYLGLIGGYIHQAPARFEVCAANEAEHRRAWSAFVDMMHAEGYANMIY